MVKKLSKKSDKTPDHYSKSRRFRNRPFRSARFSTSQLVIFGAVFALIGVYILWRAFAAPAPDVSISVAPTTITAGGSATVTWSPISVYSCWASSTPASNWTGPKNAANGNHSESVSFPGIGTYTLRIDCSGSVWATTMLVVNPPPLVCSPPSQSVYVNAAASLSASGGYGTYSWSAPGGIPVSGSGPNFNVSYGAAGSHVVTVTSQSLNANCTVNVSIPRDTQPPSVPGNLHGTGHTSSSLSMAWNPSNDTGGSGLAGYKIYRNLGSQPYAVINTITSSPGFTDHNVQPNTSYQYQVSAFDNAGNDSGRSGAITLTTDPGPPTPPPPPPPPVAVRLVANPASIAYNSYTYLQWNSTNATSCSANWTGNHNPVGTQQVGRLTSSTTYSITCSGPGGSASASARVTVGAPPASCPPNCPTPPAPPEPTKPIEAPVVEETATEPEPTPESTPPASTPKYHQNHLKNLLLGGLIGELVGLIKHAGGK